MNEEQEIRDNLIRLIQSSDEDQLELAIQLNKGLKLLDWTEIWEIIDNETIKEINEKRTFGAMIFYYGTKWESLRRKIAPKIPLEVLWRQLKDYPLKPSTPVYIKKHQNTP